MGHGNTNEISLHTCSPRPKGPRSYKILCSNPAIHALGSCGWGGLTSTELARARPGIQLRLLEEGVPGRESGPPGTAKPPELDGLPLLSLRPLLWGLPSGELDALSARSWLTARREGGGCSGASKSKPSIGPGDTG